MSTVIPVIQSTIGNTNYFQSTMTASDLVKVVRPAGESDGWAERGIEERMQREINQRRVTNEIVPYIINNEDRFFGSFVVLVLDPNIFQFEGLGDLQVTVPAAYSSQGSKMGFLTIEGGSLIALDGQHRLKAYRDVIQGEVKQVGDYSQAVPSDEVSVIFIHFENNEKTRRIFNKINRHAKATSRSDNLITSEDDASAIVARRLMDYGGPLSQKDSRGDYIINWKSNTIAVRSTKLTTLGAIYQTVKLILEHEGFQSVNDIHQRPDPGELEEMHDITTEWWGLILSNMTGFQIAVSNPSRIPQLRAMEERNESGDIAQLEGEYSLLFRPVGLEALVGGIVLALKNSDGELDLESALYRANQVEWKVSNHEWGGTIVQYDQNTPDSKKIQAGRAAVNLGSQLVAYKIGGEYFDSDLLKSFKSRYLLARNIAPEAIEFTNLDDHLMPIAEAEAEDLPI